MQGAEKALHNQSAKLAQDASKPLVNFAAPHMFDM